MAAVEKTNKSKGKRKLLYIMAPSYSGSTLLTFLLARHPSIATIGELKASALGDINQYTCSCGTPIKSCSFWSRLQDRLASQNKVLDLNDFGTHFHYADSLSGRVIRATVRDPWFEALRKMARNTLPGCQKQFLTILEQNRAIIEAVCDIQGGDVFLDGSKDPLRAMYFAESDLWDFYLINMVRDGRGTSNSDKKHSSHPIDVSAVQWGNKIKEMQRVLSMIPRERVLEVKYEQLCTSPKQYLREICEFAGLDHEQMEQDEQQDNHILGNNMRLAKLDQIRLDEKWRVELEDIELKLFDKVAGAINRGLGYQ